MKLNTLVKLKAAAGIVLKRVLPIIAGLAILVLVIAWLADVFLEKIEPGPSKVVSGPIDPNQEQEFYEVREVFKDYTEEAVGTLKAASRTAISARLLAQIDQIRVGAGQTVRAGDVVIELDRRVLETQFSQTRALLVAAQAALKQAESDYRRDFQLHQKRAISQAKMD